MFLIKAQADIEGCLAFKKYYDTARTWLLIYCFAQVMRTLGQNPSESELEVNILGCKE